MVLNFGCILAFNSAGAWVSFPDTDLIGLWVGLCFLILSKLSQVVPLGNSLRVISVDWPMDFRTMFLF